MRPGIDITEYFWGHPNPSEVVVSFSLAYPDWCKLQDSETWRQLESFLAGAQTEQEPSHRQGSESERASP